MTSSVRFEQLACKEAGCGYLFAVSIVEMKNDERERYNKYLKSAKGKGKRTHEGLKAQPSATNITPNGKPQVSTWDALTPASVDKAFEKFLSK
jgi:hypothetical protein